MWYTVKTPHIPMFTLHHHTSLSVLRIVLISSFSLCVINWSGQELSSGLEENDLFLHSCIYNYALTGNGLVPVYQVPIETIFFFHSPCSRHCSKINFVTSPYVIYFPAPGTPWPSCARMGFPEENEGKVTQIKTNSCYNHAHAIL